MPPGIISNIPSYFQPITGRNYNEPFTNLETAMKNETIFWPYYCHTLYKSQRDSILLDKITYWEQLYPSTHTYILKGDALQRTDKIKEAETKHWAGSLYGTLPTESTIQVSSHVLSAKAYL